MKWTDFFVTAGGVGVILQIVIYFWKIGPAIGRFLERFDQHGKDIAEHDGKLQNHEIRIQRLEDIT